MASFGRIFSQQQNLVTKVSLFMANYGRELKMGADIRKKEKIKKLTEFLERIKKVQEEAGMVLRKRQEKIKQQADRKRKEVEEWKKKKNIMLSMKNLMFKKRPVRKLVDQYVSPYLIEEVVFTNMVKL